MRKVKAKRRELAVDPKFGDRMVTLFVNELMYSGKKSVAFKILYDAIAKVEERTKEDGHAVWKKALENVAPGVEVKSRRIGGATFQIPIEVRPQKTSLGPVPPKPLLSKNPPKTIFIANREERTLIAYAIGNHWASTLKQIIPDAMFLWE